MKRILGPGLTTQTQIVRLCVIMACVTLLVFSFLVLALQANLALSRSSEQAQEMARVVAGATAAAVEAGRADEVANSISALGASPWLVGVTVYDTKGHVLAEHRGSAADQTCLPAASSVPLMTTRWCGARARATVTRQGTEVGEVVAVLSLGLYWQRLGLMLGYCTLAVALIVAVCTAVARRIAARMTQPLHALVGLVERVGSEHDLSIRAQDVGAPEVRTLAAGFNLMLEQLASRAQQLREMALVDPLTGLNNRRAFQSHLEQRISMALGHGQSCVLVCCDLDGFKAVNDTHGHAVGDAVLCAVGKRMRQCFRQDDFICRLGGDEFAVVLGPLPSLDVMDSLIAKLQASLSEPYVHAGRALPALAASIGIATCPGDAADANGLFRHADEAMYEAKAAGRGEVRLYSSTMADRRSRRKVIEADVAHARERGQLFLVYQPQVRVHREWQVRTPGRDTTVWGFEVLTRWRHPDLGLVGPDEFIPLAEACGCVGAIDEWVLQQAIRQLQSWQSEGYGGVRISVNLCGQQLFDAGWVARLVDQLQASRLPAGSVELEITESTLVTPTPAVLAHMDQLRDAGFGLAIDDFGIGFSALSCLEEFPLTTLKVDRSFVGKLSRPGHNDAVTRSIIAIARALGLEVIAEGVESEEQRDMLIQLGCEVMQGYLYSGPLAEDEAAGWLRRLSTVRTSDDRVVAV